MENQQGTSPLETLPLSECLDGKTDQEILNIIARHLIFTAEAGESIEGAQGAQGATGPAGPAGANGINGSTPVQSSALYTNALGGVSAGITEFSIPLSWDVVNGAEVKLLYNDNGSPPANHYITHYQEEAALLTKVFFDSALTGDNWAIFVGYWS